MARDREQEFERLEAQLDALEVAVDEDTGKLALIRPDAPPPAPTPAERRKSAELHDAMVEIF